MSTEEISLDVKEFIHTMTSEDAKSFNNGQNNQWKDFVYESITSKEFLQKINNEENFLIHEFLDINKLIYHNKNAELFQLDILF